MVSARYKLLNKIAQAAGDAPAATTTPTTTTTTTPATSVPGAPTDVPVDVYFPTFTWAWGPNFKPATNQLINILNWSMFILSQGQLSFDQLRQQNFNVDISKYPDPFLMGIIMFAKNVYYYLLNNGTPFKTQVQNKDQIIDYLSRDIASNTKVPDSLSATFPQSYLQTKIGNPKPAIIALLSNMKSLK